MKVKEANIPAMLPHKTKQRVETKVPALMVSCVLLVSICKLPARQTDTLHAKSNHTIILHEDPSHENTFYTLTILEKFLFA